MIYQEWMADAKKKLGKLSNQKLISLANSKEPDAKKIADEILLHRKNGNGRIGATNDDL